MRHTRNDNRSQCDLALTLSLSLSPRSTLHLLTIMMTGAIIFFSPVHFVANPSLDEACRKLITSDDSMEILRGAGINFPDAIVIAECIGVIQETGK